MTSGDAARAAETYTDLRRTAIHEAGHGVMAYLVGRPFTTITVLPDDDALGYVQHAPPGDWFRPDIEVTQRVRHRAEQHIMIGLAGAETEQRWVCNADDAPADWEHHLEVGARHDRDGV